MEEQTKDNELVFDDREIENLSDTPMRIPNQEEEQKLKDEIRELFDNWKDRYE